MFPSPEPWTIARICVVLGRGEWMQQCLAEIIQTSADDLLTVFAKWQGLAQNTLPAAG